MGWYNRFEEWYLVLVIMYLVTDMAHARTI